MPPQCTAKTASALSPRRVFLLLLLGLGCLLLPACRRRSAAKEAVSVSPAQAQAQAPTQSAAKTEAQGNIKPVTGAPGIEDPVVATTQVPLFTGTPPEMQAINLKIRDFWEYYGREPRSIDDLVRARLIPAPPKLPPGRQLVIGPDKWTARLQ